MNNNPVVIRAAIIEDEIPAARLLNHMLAELRPEWEILLLPGNIEEAAEWFSENTHPDLLFLDIQLTDGNSFLLIEKACPKSMIVFTTAFDTYAVRAFTVNSIDYLLKPIHRERLAETLDKFDRLHTRYSVDGLPHQEEMLEVLRSLSNPIKRYRTRFLVSVGERLVTLPVGDVAYFYSENRVTFAVTKQGREHIVDFSLDKLSEQLNPDYFFRTNRQTLVGIDAIRKIEPYFQNKVVVDVLPPFKDKILVSKEKIASFKVWLNY